MSSPTGTDGFLDFDVPEAGKSCKTWYTAYGDLKSSKFPPLIVLHGGPGMPSNYLKAYGQLADKASIPVVLYDSIGCGNSTPLPEKMGDGSFFNIDLHIRELDNLLKGLGVEEDFSFLGHSYGAALAAWYTATRQPKGLRRLILHSPLPSWKLWDEAQMDLRHQLPQELQDILNKHEAETTTDSPEYKDVITEFYRRHVCRINPFPMDLQETLEAAARDPTVVFTMYGEDEFHTLGTVKDWSMTDEIHKINVPTLLMNGRYDTAQDKVVEPFFNKIPKVRWVQFPESSHTAHLETERERIEQIVSVLIYEHGI
ncbi:hypothetical protein Clacol_005226 [Clathrus columnatus]|uniref:AB hydrolase-1 domain-containing protein n=1 Tax=Clathrus columnatus TaxID=1419009 RepID=A0AAV5A8P5_9AGAM|nr:hypothetical protein Clacol_005226 [Clathrus columnatus]